LKRYIFLEQLTEKNQSLEKYPKRRRYHNTLEDRITFLSPISPSFVSDFTYRDQHIRRCDQREQCPQAWWGTKA
jgi:hypothetical protein